mmetsp:Transcript_44577/g.121480  ORF Transcript_44577/g.121480 Transcript_44577/m.121480 type:complete len:183 (-) Transcript_44577:194-742(-)
MTPSSPISLSQSDSISRAGWSLKLSARATAPRSPIKFEWSESHSSSMSTERPRASSRVAPRRWGGCEGGRCCCAGAHLPCNHVGRLQPRTNGTSVADLIAAETEVDEVGMPRQRRREVALSGGDIVKTQSVDRIERYYFFSTHQVRGREALTAEAKPVTMFRQQLEANQTVAVTKLVGTAPP